MNGFEFELTTLVVMGTDCTGNCKSNYHTTTTPPERILDCTKYILQKKKKKKETEHVKKYNLLQIFNIILNTEISITLH